MVKEVYHIWLDHSYGPKRFLYGFAFIYILLVSSFIIFPLAFGGLNRLIETIPTMLYIVGVSLLFMAPMFFGMYFATKYAGWGVSDEVIIYDNGWITMFGMGQGTGGYGWCAPFRIEWVLPPGTVCGDKDHPIAKVKYPLRVLKKRKDKALIHIGFVWVLPNSKYENRAFNASVQGWVSKKQYDDVKKMIDYVINKAKENIEKGLHIPQGDGRWFPDLLYYADTWNEIALEQGVWTEFKKELGENVPEPLRTFFDDTDKYKKYYWRNKLKTGDWYREPVKRSGKK